MYICFILESHEPWTYWLIFFIIFLLLYHHFSSYLFVYILCLCHHISFYAMSDDLPYFSEWRTVMSLSTSISWTLVQRSLVEKVILSKRVHVHHCLRVYPFYYVFSKELIYWYSECTQVKEKIIINKRMYTMSFSIEYLYWPLKVPFVLVSCLWEFICELSRDSHLLVSILCTLHARDKWPFLRDSRSLSSPSLHTLVIWLFSMTWFEWISAHSFSFDLFVHLTVFHSPCLHCSLFISIYIPRSIFSTHHSYTSHQQFEILHFFFFIIDILILDSFFLTDIFILGILRSMIYETFCTYCILYMSVWGFIIGII